MSDRTSSKSRRRLPILLIFSAVWFLLLAAVSMPRPAAQNGDNPAPYRGGRLYVAWDLVSEVDTSTITKSPLWPSETPNQVPNPVTRRCVNCHGWDYRGSDGKTLGAVFRTMGYPGLFSHTAEPVEDIIPILKGALNPDHDFSEFLSDSDLQDLAAFISEGLIGPELIADSNSFVVEGSAEEGKIPYNEYCISCHGAEGERINLNTVENPTYLGDISLRNPWKMVHTIRYGHITGVVPTGRRLEIPFSQQIDIAAYTQSFPTAEIISGPEYQDIDLSAQANTARLAYGAIAIAALVFLAVIITIRRNRLV